MLVLCRKETAHHLFFDCVVIKQARLISQLFQVSVLEMTMNLVSIGVFGRAPLQKLHQLHQRVIPNASSSSNSNSKKNLEFGANSMFFLELLKGCSKNTSFTPTRGVRGYLPTIATNYTTYPFVSIFPSPHPGFFTYLPFYRMALVRVALLK